jgi:hypothetical protein
MCKNIVIKLSLCLYMYHEIDVDDKSYLYQMLIDYTCMLRIGCKPMILITLNMAKTCLKVIKVNCCKIKILYRLKPFNVYKLTAWSCQVRLAEHSHSSIGLVLSAQVRF